MRRASACPTIRGSSRRRLIWGGVVWLLAGRALADELHRTASPVHDAHASGGHGAPSITPAEAQARLMAGNARFAKGASIHPDLAMSLRRSLAGGQHPFAVILACADSRVAPELIFDQGLGDLFVVRVAGNVVDDAVLGSIEYAVLHLGSPLVMVLGHERCGAVTATVEALEGKGSEGDKATKIGALADLIAPAVRAVPASAADKLDAAIVLNAERMAEALVARSAPLKARAHSGILRVVSARYDLDDGTVSAPRTAQA